MQKSSDTFSVAKDRQLGAWSSTWAKLALVFLVGGLGAGVAHVLLSTSTDNNSATGGLLSTLSFGDASIISFVFSGVSLLLARRSVKERNQQTWHEFEEARLRTQNEVRFRSLISATGDAYVELGEDGSIMEWNERAAVLFGWSSEEVLGRSAVDILMPSHERAAAFQRLQSFWYDDERAAGRRFTSTTEDRSGRTLYVETTMWINEGSERRMNLFMRDHTDRHDIEEAVQQALADKREAEVRLQEIDRVKNDFVSSISHELRSPLTSTLGYLELLSDGDAGALDPQQARMIEIASRNAKRLQTLIEDLLTLSRIESGSFRVHFRPLELRSAIDAAVQQSSVAASERSVEVETAGVGEVGLVPGDNKELTRALGNIVSNAVKFTPPGGTVSIRVDRAPERVRVIIKDTGIGIPVEEQAHLFSRFYRASAAVVQQHQGAGLGLTIAKTIFEHHGGSIDVQSDPAFGTTVTVELPALPMDDVEEPAVRSDADSISVVS